MQHYIPVQYFYTFSAMFLYPYSFSAMFLYPYSFSAMFCTQCNTSIQSKKCTSYQCSIYFNTSNYSQAITFHLFSFYIQAILSFHSLYFLSLSLIIFHLYISLYYVYFFVISFMFIMYLSTLRRSSTISLYFMCNENIHFYFFIF